MTLENVIILILSAIAWLITLGVLIHLNHNVVQLKEILDDVLESLDEVANLHDLHAFNDGFNGPDMELAPILPPDEPEGPAPPFWNDISQLSAAIKRIEETGEVPNHDQLFALSPNDAYHAVADRIELLERQ